MSTLFYYKITSKHSGKCLDASGWSRENGARIIQWDWHGGANQRWQLLERGSFNSELVAVFRNLNSEKCLDVSGWSRDNGAEIIQWDYHGGDNQRWRLVPVGDDPGYYYLRSIHSDKCLDVYGWSRENGTAIVQWDCHGGDNQKWQLTLVQSDYVHD